MSEEVSESTGTGASESDLNLLSEEDETKVDSSKDEEDLAEESTSEEDEEPEEEEEEEPETSEEDEEDTSEEEAQITRPSWKVIKEKYPELAKDKDFKNVFFRDKAFSELFPTVQDAKDAAEKTNLFDYLDGALAAGKPEELIASLNKPTLAKFAERILPALHSLDVNMFKAATQPLIFEILNEIHDIGAKNNDENLQISVKNIAKALTGKFEVPPRSRRADPELEAERKALEDEKNHLIQTQRASFYERADKSIDRQLRKAIEEGLDPKGDLTDFTKNAIIKEVLSEVKSTVNQDQAFVSKMKHLGKLAEKAGYPPDYMPRVISAYLGRAKTLALSLRAKHKAAAIGKKRNPDSKIRVEGSSKKEETNQNKNDRGKVNYRKMSDLDIINS